MGIPLVPPPKRFATPAGAGVPLDELPDLIGQPIDTQLSTTNLADEAAWGNGHRLTGQPVDVAQHDRITIEHRDGNTVLGRWRIDVDEWRRITVGAQGADLSIGNLGVSKPNLLYASTIADDDESILIGRTSTNRILVQRQRYTTDATSYQVNAYARYYDDGVLGRRLLGTTGGVARDSVLKIRSAAKPADPAGVTFDASGNAIPGSDGYVRFTDPDPAGSDPLWYATAHNPYNTADETYGPVEAWIVTPASSSTPPEFSTDQITWTAAPPDAVNYYVRVRDSMGAWQVFEIGRGVRTSWTRFAYYAGGTGTFAVIAAQNGGDWTEYQLIELLFRQRVRNADDQVVLGNVRSIVMPASRFLSGGNSDPGALVRDTTVHAYFSDTGSDWSRGEYGDFSGLVNDVNGQYVQITAYGYPLYEQRMRHIRVTPSYIGDGWHFDMRGI